jgi:hypothetical protein
VAAAAAAAAPVLKPGGKAQHCTLGTVSIIEIGPMGATIEFFSALIEGSLMLKFNKAKRKAEKEMMEQAAGHN